MPGVGRIQAELLRLLRSPMPPWPGPEAAGLTSARPSALPGHMACSRGQRSHAGVSACLASPLGRKHNDDAVWPHEVLSSLRQVPNEFAYQDMRKWTPLVLTMSGLSPHDPAGGLLSP